MDKSTRTYKSVKNSIYAFGGQIISIILSFVSRTIFIHTLGAVYLGVNGLFTNILYVLSFAELGFSTAIIYELYRPLAENNERAVSALMNLYAKIYRIIGCSIFFVGILLCPNLEFFIKDLSVIPSDLPPLWIIYILFLINTSVSYFFNYKRSIIVASQNGYIDSLNLLQFNLLKNILQIAVLVVFNSFVGFLVIQIICTFLGNVSVSYKADKLFPFLAKYKSEKVDKTVLHSIKKNVLGMAFSKLGGVVVGGIDNLFISKFIGVIAVGCYANYLLLTQTLKTIFIQLFTPLTASVGNYVVSKSVEDTYTFFKKILFFNAYLAIFFSCCLASIVNSFIGLVWGEEYVFSTLLTIGIVFNFYIDRIRQTSQIFIDVNGLFWQIKWRALIEAVVNIILSILFVKVLKLGLSGIILAILLCNIFVNFWWEPYVVFHSFFYKNMTYYYYANFKYVAVLISGYLLLDFVNNYLPYNMLWLILRVVIDVFVINIYMYVIFRHSPEYQYMINTVLRILNKKIK